MRDEWVCLSVAAWKSFEKSLSVLTFWNLAFGPLLMPSQQHSVKWHHLSMTSCCLCQRRKQKCHRLTKKKKKWRTASDWPCLLSTWGHLCVHEMEFKALVWEGAHREGAAAGAGEAPRARKTSGPAGLLRGRSECVDSLLQQMKEQKWLCLLSPAHLPDAKDATWHRVQRLLA